MSEGTNQSKQFTIMAPSSPELFISHCWQAVGAPVSALLPVSLPHTWLHSPLATLGQAPCPLAGRAAPALCSVRPESSPPSEVLFRHTLGKYCSSAPCQNCNSDPENNLKVAVRRCCRSFFHCVSSLYVNLLYLSVLCSDFP